MPTFAGGKDGYKQALGKDKKIPYKLSLNVEDIQRYRIKDVSFTPAKFDDSKDGNEKYIVSSTGSFLITWSLRNIVKDHKNKYEVI
jgi:hypothetical protein